MSEQWTRCRTHKLTTGMASPPVTRSTSRTSTPAVDIDSVVEAVVTRLVGAGLVGAVTGAAADAPSDLEDVKPDLGATAPEEGPSRAQRRLWLEELRTQQAVSARFGPREKEEVRGLLIIGGGGGPPEEHRTWFWARVRLMLIVAHHGWAAAVADAQHSDLDRLGIRLSSAAPVPAAAAAPVAQPVRRGRPSRPSGLRPPPRRAAPPAAPRRAD